LYVSDLKKSAPLAPEKAPFGPFFDFLCFYAPGADLSVGDGLKTMLTIAGFDPSAGAGVTADLAVFAAFGLFGTACITGLTVQSTVGVRSVHPVEAHLVTATLEYLVEDLSLNGIKIGLLTTAENVLAVADFLGKLRLKGWQAPVVLDPVIRSTSDRELLSQAGIAALKQQLLPLVDWVTPNLAELSELTGHPVRTAAEIEVAAAALQRLATGLGVVATGGHLESADDLTVRADGHIQWLSGERIESRSTHGTGCAFSSALACGLVEGRDPVGAARRAKEFVAEAIRRATPIGHGNGPMNLLWPLKPDD
jgi:hydroxymethylpyrimidine/phosphomethylpyrimidine kinase